MTIERSGTRAETWPGGRQFPEALLAEIPWEESEALALGPSEL